MFVSIFTIFPAFLLSAVFILVTLHFFTRRKSAVNLPDGIKRVPVVKGGLPFVGHGLHTIRDIRQFMSNCYKTYGGIFQVKLFLKTIVVVCDPKLAQLYFKENEKVMSLEDALKSLNFDWPFYKNKNGLKNAIDLFRKSIAVNFSDLSPKIDLEARRTAIRLQDILNTNSNEIFNLNMEMYRFIARTSLTCFASMEMDEELLVKLKRFNQIANRLIVASYFLPKWFIQFACNWKIIPLRHSVVSHFESQVQKYRENEYLTESRLLRKAIDYNENKEGGQLTNQDVGELILGFMFISTENTAVGLKNAVTYLIQPENAAILEKLREECKEIINDTEKLLSAPFLNACVLETARLSTHFFAIHRVPKSKYTWFGDYLIENVDSIAVAGHMLMANESCSQGYRDPMKFNPERFLGDRQEPKNPPNLISWGAGAHQCPGKIFAIMEIKFALAHLVLNFDMEIEGKLPEFDYFSSAALADRNVLIQMKTRSID